MALKVCFEFFIFFFGEISVKASNDQQGSALSTKELLLLLFLGNDPSREYRYLSLYIMATVQS